MDSFLIGSMSVPDSSVGKESACNAGHLGSIPGSRRSAGEGVGYPLQHSGLENSVDCIGHGVTKSRTGLSDFHFTHFTGAYEKSIMGLSATRNVYLRLKLS